jgi:hypothetical protein
VNRCNTCQHWERVREMQAFAKCDQLHTHIYGGVASPDGNTSAFPSYPIIGAYHSITRLFEIDPFEPEQREAMRYINKVVTPADFGCPMWEQRTKERHQTEFYDPGNPTMFNMTEEARQSEIAEWRQHCEAAAKRVLAKWDWELEREAKLHALEQAKYLFTREEFAQEYEKITGKKPWLFEDGGSA